jgi:hypothetical protein
LKQLGKHVHVQERSTCFDVDCSQLTAEGEPHEMA